MQPKIVPTLTITQAEIPPLVSSFRITAYPVVVRSVREQLGGGFGDQNRHPHAWTVLLQVDGLWARVESSRGSTREWTNLDRLERWLRDHGFRYIWLQNELDPVEADSMPRPGMK
ncbi:MAG: hypothetical protein KDA21_08990 [Phycisphaerales bacterium]|nr:hypothetical protein [Phycisphaerales bacterium]